MPKERKTEAAAAFMEGGKTVHDERTNRRPSLEDLTGRETVHVHAVLFKDDHLTAKEIAWRKHTTVQAILRDAFSEWVQAHRNDTE